MAVITDNAHITVDGDYDVKTLVVAAPTSLGTASGCTYLAGDGVGLHFRQLIVLVTQPPETNNQMELTDKAQRRHNRQYM